MMNEPVSLYIGMVCSLLIVFSFILPCVYEYSFFTELDGIAGYLDHIDIWTTVDPLTGSIYGIGDICCHQEQARSLIINGSQMPFCARDTAIIAGISISIFLWEFVLRSRNILDRKVLIFSVILIFFTVSEWSVEHYCGIDDRGARVMCGMVTGIGVGTLIRSYFMYRKKMM